MPKSLIALGSNLGDRAATLDAAVASLGELQHVRVVRQSRWHETQPSGGPNLTRAFLNGAVVLETQLEPRELLERLREIESSHGRERHQQWADRTLDLDLLLYGDRVCETPALVVPHPRMSFRRFVLEPAVEIAGEWVHPTIGRTLAKLLEQLNSGGDFVAIVSQDELARSEVAIIVADSFSVASLAPPLEDAKWPAAHTTWLGIPSVATSTGARLPKLSILLDPVGDENAAWNAIAKQPGRGPTLRIAAAPAERVAREVCAAVEAVWPRLGQPGR